MPEYQFSHTPHKLPTEHSYVQVATAYIAQVAPTLPNSVRDRVALLSASAMFSDERLRPHTILEDPVLQLCERWCWPEAEAAMPFSLNYESGYSVAHHLWRGDQWSAHSEAGGLMREAESTKISDWLYNVPMTLVRQWRDKLLPSRPKRGRKWELLLDLKQHPDFPAEVAAAYHGWKEELLAQAEALMVEANKPAVPMHLSWLITQVLCYLDNYHTATNSSRGPDAHAALCEQLVHAARNSPPPLDEDALHCELQEVFSAHIRFGDPGFSSPVPLAWGYIEKLRASLTPEAIALELGRHSPAKLLCLRPCARCESGLTKKHKTVAPFDILCSCSTFIWVPKNFKGTEHDWKFGQQADLDATIWALDRLLGVNEAQIDTLALYVRAGTYYGENEYRPDVKKLMVLGAKMASRYANLAAHSLPVFVD